MKEYELKMPVDGDYVYVNASSIKELNKITKISNSSLYRIKTHPEKYINKQRKHKYKDYALSFITLEKPVIKNKIKKIKKKEPVLPKDRNDHINVSFGHIILSFD